MSFSRLRNGKARLIVGFALAALTLLLTYVIHDTHTKLTWTRSQALECEHKRESLAAQLQVTGEHKSRLEKALQQEKSSHKHTKDKLESQYEELQEQMDKEKQEALKKSALLQQQLDALKAQHETLQREFGVLQQTNSELQQEKQNLDNKMTSQMDQLRIAKDEELLQLQNDYSNLLREKDELAKKLDKTLNIQELEASIKECKTEKSVLKQSLARLKSLPYQSLEVHNKNGPPLDLNPAKVDAAMDMKHEVAYLAQMPKLEKPRQDVKLQLDTENEKHVGPAPPLNGHNRDPSHASPQKNNASEMNDGHQLAIPVVLIDEIVNKQLDEGAAGIGRQLEQPNARVDDKKKTQQLAEPPFAHLESKVGADSPFRREAELVANGLEQQEMGEDEDLDNMENEVAGNDRKESNRLEDADFDQDDNEGNRGNNHPLQVKQEGVIAAPHKR